MKRIIAFSLVLMTVFTFVISGCSKTDTENVETTTIVQNNQAETTAVAQENQEETTLTQKDQVETTISWDEAAVLRAQKLVATKEDFEVLEWSAKMIMCTSSGRGYDSSSDTAFMDAMYMIYNTGVKLVSEINGRQFEIEHFGNYDEDAGKFVFEPDPLNKFEDIEDIAGYVKIDADDVDWILENVLCVTPDRTKTSDDFDYSSYPNAEEYYYYDGYYYYSAREGGGGADNFHTIGYQYNRDGSYTVRFTTFNSDSEDEYDVENGMYYGYSLFEANASLTDVDGERVWAMSYVKAIEHIEQE